MTVYAPNSPLGRVQRAFEARINTAANYGHIKKGREIPASELIIDSEVLEVAMASSGGMEGVALKLNQHSVLIYLSLRAEYDPALQGIVFRDRYDLSTAYAS